MSKNTFTSNMSGPIDTKFVLNRTNMVEAFTDDEYDICRAKMSAGHSVAVQYASGGLCEAQLIRTKSDGALVFSRSGDGLIVTYTVSPGATHTITTNTYNYQ